MRAVGVTEFGRPEAPHLVELPDPVLPLGYPTRPVCETLVTLVSE